MGAGAIPPPHRGPRSLVGPPTVLPKERYTSPSSKNATSQFDHSSSSAADDPRRTGSAYKDEQRKMNRMMQQQAALEEESVSKDSMIESLTSDSKLMKQKKQNVDSESAQSTADFMNIQARWLQEVDASNDEVQALKSKLAQSQRSSEAQHKESTALQERDQERQSEQRKQEVNPNRPENLERQADKLEIHQNRSLISESKALHQKSRKELNEQKELNERLRVSNEEYKDTIDQYQFLLIERTVKGNLNTHVSPDGQTDSAGETSLSGEELMSEEESMGAPERAGPATDSNEVSSAETLAGTSKSDGARHSSDDSQTTVEITASTDKRPSHQRAADQQMLRRQQFESASLRNHNRALKVSLESLIARLLENRSFSQIVEESISPSLVNTFRTRMAPHIAPKMAQQPSASSAASMMFNQNYTGNPTRRVFSMGVDNEVKGAPPAPTSSSDSEASGNSGGTLSVASSQVSEYRKSTASSASLHSVVDGNSTIDYSPGRRSSSMTASLGQRAVSPFSGILLSPIAVNPSASRMPYPNKESASKAHSNGASADAIIPSDFDKQNTTRVESLTGVRKLRMRE